MTNLQSPTSGMAEKHPAAPRYRLDPTDKVTIDGIDYVPKSSDKDGHILRRLDDLQLCVGFSHADIEICRQEGNWHHSRGFFLAANARVRVVQPEQHFNDLSPALREKILFRKRFCDEFLRLEDQGAATRSDASIKGAVREIFANDLLSQLDDGRCGGGDIATKRPPSPRTLRRWLGFYSACDWIAMSLADNYGRSGNREPRFEVEERMLIKKYADMFASRLQPTRVSLLGMMHREIRKENKKRDANGERLLVLPSRSALARAIDQLDPFYVIAGRESPEAARRKLAIVNGGMSVTRPLERVEIDEDKLPLQTLLMDAGLWPRLTPKQQEEVTRHRFWLCTAIDGATRCCLAAVLVENPSEASALATLEMSVGDKSAYAAASGCNTPWDMFGTGECYANDSASWFKSSTWRGTIIDLGSEILFPTTGMPQLRGRQERFYGTLHRGLIDTLSGKTFLNPVAKGDYDSEANAFLDPSELYRMIIRWLVDVYHNTPHGGLDGETPRNAWLRLTKSFPVMSPPDREAHRHIFGLTLERRITNRGIRIFGLHYQSPALLPLRRLAKDRRVRVRLDRGDLGSVSVRLPIGLKGDTGWVPVECLNPRAQGMPISIRVEGLALARSRNRASAKLTEEIVDQALDDIEAFSRSAAKRIGIYSPLFTAEDANRIDRDLARSFDFVRTEGDSPEVLDAEPDDTEAMAHSSRPVDTNDIGPDKSSNSNWIVED